MRFLLPSLFVLLIAVCTFIPVQASSTWDNEYVRIAGIMTGMAGYIWSVVKLCRC